MIVNQDHTWVFEQAELHKRLPARQDAPPAFSPEQALDMLDAPVTVGGLRDRAILSVGFLAGPRRSEIAHLAVRDFCVNAGFDSPRVHQKGGKNG